MKRILLMIGLVLVMGTSSATEYYLSPTGNNSKDGQSIANAWATLDHADGTVKNPGDILYVLNGTYTGQVFAPQGSGNITHPIEIKAYNGTPVFDGDSYISGGKKLFNSNGYDNYSIDGFKILDYYYGIHMTNTEDWNISNCTFTHIYYHAVAFGDSTKDCTLYNSTLYNVRWNFVQVGGGTAGVLSSYVQNIHITDNEFYNDVDHGFIDLMHGFQYIYLENNYIHDGSSAAAIYVHQTVADNFPESGYIYVRNNIVHDCNGGVRFDDPANNSVIEDNTIYALYGSPPLGRHVKIIDPTYNLTCTDNDFWGDTYSSLIGAKTIDSLWDGNNITAESGDYEFDFERGANTIRNAHVSGKDWFRVYSPAGYDTTVEFTDGRTFSIGGSGEYTNYTWNTAGTRNLTIMGVSGYNISGYIKYENNTGINNVHVINNVTAVDDYSDINGYYNLVSMDNNSYLITATKVGFDTNSTVTTVNGANVNNVNITLAEIVWSSSNTGNYWNLSNPISITVKSDGTHVFSRNPTQNDDNATSFRMVVKT